MSARGTAAALRLYASPVFLRGNPVAFVALLYIGIFVAFQLPGARHAVALHGLRAALSQNRSEFLFQWGGVASFLPGALVFHYARQVRSSLAIAVPGLVASEFRAIVIATLAAAGLLAAPLIWLTARPLGPLAAALLAAGFGTAGMNHEPKAEARWVQVLRGLMLMPPLLIASLFPNALVSLLLASPRVTLPLNIVAGLAIWLGLRFDPAAAASVADDRETPVRHPAHARPAWLQAMRRVLIWQPHFLRRAPQPRSLRMMGGTLGIPLSMFLVAGLMLGAAILTGRVHGISAGSAIHSNGAGGLAAALSIRLLPAARWLTEREEWPLLFIAGWHGGRFGFASAMFRGFFWNSVQMAVSAMLVVLVVGLWAKIFTLAAAPATAFCTGAILFGATYASAVPLLWRRFSGKTEVAVALTISYTGALLLLLTVLTAGPEPWVVAVAAALLLGGIVMSYCGPRRMAAMDWPLEAP